MGSTDIGDFLSLVGFKVPIQIYPFTWLVDELKKLVDFQSYDSFIWPGRGGKLIRDSLSFLGKVGIIEVPAKRIGLKDPKVIVESFQAPKGKVAVIDDVISSGTTAVGIYQQGNLKKADLITPIMQCPEDCKLKYYEQIFAAFLVRGPQGKIPINSISTFLTNSSVLESYADRFCAKPEDLMIAIELIIKEVDGEI